MTIRMDIRNIVWMWDKGFIFINNLLKTIFTLRFQRSKIKILNEFNQVNSSSLVFFLLFLQSTKIDRNLLVSVLSETSLDHTVDPL